MHYGNFTVTKGISQEFSDCRLHMTNIQKISLMKIVGFVPSCKVWRDLKFVGCAEGI
jgi:hypothetical protein